MALTLIGCVSGVSSVNGGTYSVLGTRYSAVPVSSNNKLRQSLRTYFLELDAIWKGNCCQV